MVRCGGVVEVRVRKAGVRVEVVRLDILFAWNENKPDVGVRAGE